MRLPLSAYSRSATEAISRYSSVAVSELEERVFSVSDLNEKPSPEKIFQLCHFGPLCSDTRNLRYSGNPGPRLRREIQRPTALRPCAIRERMVAVDFEGRRYDTGNLCGFLEATLEIALDHPKPAIGCAGI